VSGRLISIGDAIESQRAAENGHLRLPETRGMTVLMKNSQKVLPFPRRLECIGFEFRYRNGLLGLDESAVNH
jgi:hypothetical protein